MSEIKTKKLLVLIWNMGLGGVQKRVRDLILDINKNYPEWEVNLLVKNKEPEYFSPELMQLDHVRVYYFEDIKYKLKTPLITIWWIIKNYLYIKPDISMTFLDRFSIYMVWVRFLCFWQKSKLVLNEGILTSQYLKIYYGRYWFLWRILVAIHYRFADRIIVPSQACKEDLTRIFFIPASKIFVVPNWTLYKPGVASNFKYDLVFVGRFEIEKNIMALVDVIVGLKRDFPKIKLCMIGSGSQEKVFKKSIKKNGLEKNIEIAGYQKDVRRYLLKSKIFVLPTVNEGLPNVVLEAGMCQVPTIANNFYGVEEVVLNGKTGYVVNDISEFVKQISRILKNEKLRTRLGINAQIFVQKKFGLRNQKKFIDLLFFLK